MDVEGGGREGTPVTAPPVEADAFDERLHNAAEDAVGFEVVQAEIAAPSAPRRILDYAERIDADLVVMATHGRSWIRRFWLGSATEKVVQLAPCPVFTVKVFGKSLLSGVAVKANNERT